MTVAGATVPSRPPRAGRVPSLALPGRLLRLELRRNAMPWLLPLVAALFWLVGYRYAMSFPPFWGLRSPILPDRALNDFALFGAGVAAWMGSRDGRRRTTDLVTVTAQPRWAGQLATWAATTCWAIGTYLGCVAVLYGVTAHQGAWGGPPLWPVAVGAAGVAALCAVGFAAGAYFPGRFIAPLTAFAAFLVLEVAFNIAANSHSPYALISPVSTQGALRADSGIFYHYLPDLSIAQVMFLAGLAAAALGALGLPAKSGGRWLRRTAAAVTAAGLVAAGTAVGLAGTARIEAHGVVIPALHDAASDRPIPYSPVCGHSVVPVCLHPAYRAYLPAVTAALAPVLSQLADLPGAPVRVTQVAYLNGGAYVTGGNATVSGSPPVLRLPLAFYLPTPHPLELVRWKAAPTIVSNIIGGGTSGTSGGSPAQQAVRAALLAAAGLPLAAQPRVLAVDGMPRLVPGSQVYAAAQRFAALPAAARHAWLATHLAALRAGRVALKELP
jgi:hypothetical protein